jgi:hypothetical protein
MVWTEHKFWRGYTGRRRDKVANKLAARLGSRHVQAHALVLLVEPSARPTVAPLREAVRAFEQKLKDLEVFRIRKIPVTYAKRSS